jgi:ethanolaminephosphotransferase
MAGSSVLFYLHMDALDGKQARRTKTSSPLGQLFDHGCDALAVHLILVTMATSLQLRHEWRAIMAMMYVYVPWWLAHWEEYHSGLMLYGNGLWGVTEANYAVVLLHYYTYVFGPKGWTSRPFAAVVSMPIVGDVLPSRVCSFLGALGINDTLLILFGTLGLHLLTQQVVRVFMLAGSRMLEETLPPSERGNKTLGKFSAAMHLAQILVTAASGAAIMLLPSYVPGQARVHCATFGVTYAMQATRLIMAHMAKEPFSVATWPLILIAVQVANHWLAVLDPVLLAYAVNAVVVAGYLHYVLSMIGEICGYLGINALTISKRSAD